MSIQHNCAEYINCQIYKNVCRIQKVFCRLQYDEVSTVLSCQYPVFSLKRKMRIFANVQIGIDL